MKESHDVEVEKVDNQQVDSKTEKQKEVYDPRQKSWQEAAREAGVILISEEDHLGVVEGEADETVEVEVEVKETPKEKGKRKKPKESRTEMKVMTEDKVSESNKKTFKEAFNTDKSRLEKRQSKYSKPQNFLLLLEDNVGSAPCTTGKLMAYGKGNVAERFVKEGLKYNNKEFYFHKTTHNFSENTEIRKDVEVEEGEASDMPDPGPVLAQPGPGSSQGPTPWSGALGSCSPSQGSGPRKVLTPGSFPSTVSSSEEESD